MSRSCIPVTMVMSVVALMFLISPAGAGITWTGAINGNWDTATTNWTGDATTFADDGTIDVTFDSSAGGTIVIAPNMSPTSTTVSASSGTYTFTGGPIDSGSLIKSGGGTLVVNSDHAFTGKTVVSNGTLQINDLSNAGEVGPLGAPTGAGATIDMRPGTLLKFVPPDIRSVYFSTDRTINLAGQGPGTVSLECRWNDKWSSFGAVTGTGSGPRTLRLLPSGDRARIRITGPIADTSDEAVSLEVHFTSQSAANGRAILEGTNTFSGPITLTTARTSRPDYVDINGSGSLGAGTYSNTISIQTSITLNYASAADQVLAGDISGGGNLNLSGAGTVTLSGRNSYSGATRVNSGGLVGVAGGACSNSAVSVAAGALTVSVVDNSMQWTCGTLDYSSANALEFAFGTTTPGTNTAPLMVTGDLILSAAAPVISCTGSGVSGLSPGAYPLVRWTGSISGLTPSLTIPSGNGNLVRDDVSKTLWLNITASEQPLAWLGGGDNTWVANEAEFTKWMDAASAGVNYQEYSSGGGVLGDSVVFSNATGGTVTLDTTVYPASVVLRGSTNYTISGSGGIAGGGSLTKDGASTHTLATANTYAGPTRVNDGTLRATVGGAIGAGQAYVANGATLHLAHSNAVADSAGITLETSGSSLLCDTDISLSALTFNFRANYRFTGGQGLNFLPGGTLSNADNRDWITLTNTITGSPEVLIKDFGVGNQYKGFIFAPDHGSQRLGDIINPMDRTPNGPDKAGVNLGGSTTGNSAARIYYEGGNRYGTVHKSGTGIWTVLGDINTGTYRHELGTLICNGTIKADYQGFVFTAGRLEGNCTLIRNDRRGNIVFPSDFVVAPGTGADSVGAMTVDWGSSGNPTASQQWFTFLDGSVFEWEVGAYSNDLMHVVDGKVDLDSFVLKIIDAGGTPDFDDQLPVFTYEAGVTIDMTGFSNTVSNFDATEVPEWVTRQLSLVDNGRDTIYLTGLISSHEGILLLVR